jgi:hypothetical protein
MMRNDDRLALLDFLETIPGASAIAKILNGPETAVQKELRNALTSAFCAGILQGRKKKNAQMFKYGLVTGLRRKK